MSLNGERAKSVAMDWSEERQSELEFKSEFREFDFVDQSLELNWIELEYK